MPSRGRGGGDMAHRSRMMGDRGGKGEDPRHGAPRAGPRRATGAGSVCPTSTASTQDGPVGRVPPLLTDADRRVAVSEGWGWPRLLLWPSPPDHAYGTHWSRQPQPA